MATLAHVLPSASAAELAGTTLTLDGKRVPLPSAAWTLLAERSSAIQSPVSARAATLDSVVAGASEADALRYLVVARTNRAATEGGFGLAAACRRHDLHSARVVSRDGSTVAVCSFVAHVVHGAPENADPAWRDALAAAARRGAPVPRTWLVVGVRIADADDLLDVRYYFNPEAIGFAPRGPAVPAAGPAPDGRWRDSGWSVAAVAGDARRAAVVRALDAWAEQVHARVYAGFKGRPAEALAPPAPWTGAPPAVVPAVAESEPGDIALWKTATWRALGSGLDAAVAFVFTGSLGTAGGITIVGGVVNATVYYLHERLWTAFGVAHGPGDLVTELPAAGIER